MNTAVKTTATQAEPRVSYSSRKTLGQALKYTVIIGIGLLFAFPFIWLVMTSLKSPAEILAMPPTLFPKEWQWENYQKAVTAIPFFRYMGNTVFIFLLKAIGAALSCSLAAYGFSMLRWPGRDVVFVLVLATMMLPFQVTMIPGYLILARLGLINNLAGLIVGSAFSAFGIFLVRQFAFSIPNEMLDAGRVDGASEWRIFWSIAVPQLGPALATLGMLTFMWNWNAYLWPLIILTEQDKRTLPIILTWYSTQHSNQIQLTMAASVIVVIPILLVFLLAQRWIVRGLTLSGMKG